MFKDAYRLYTKISLIILAFILFLPLTKLAAHNSTKSPWLFINDTPISEDMENPIPNPSKLDWGEHVFSEEIVEGGTLKVSIDRSAIERDLEVQTNNIATSYKLTKEDFRMQFNEDFSKSLETTGNYFLDIVLTKREGGQEIISETIMIVVGDREELAKFSVNGEEIELTSASPTFTVTDSYNLKFSVTNPGDFNYTWDLGTGETKNGIAVDYSYDKAKIPVYVILRKQNKKTTVFSDSYVRIDSPKENTFGIPRPPVKIPEKEIANNNVSTIFGLGIGAVIIFTIVSILIYRKRNS
ncbi:MAG: hypothetical protein ABIM99_03810 [Candidatus Dojkabacteria bacterium]